LPVGAAAGRAEAQAVLCVRVRSGRLPPARVRRLVAVAGVVALVALPAANGGGTSAARGQADASAWLFDPLRVNAIELEASPAALASLRSEPRSYVDAQVTLHDGGTTYGPYAVGLRLRGHTSFRDLDGKPAFKVKLGDAAGRELAGLKSLTLNNMVQDPSMLAEAMSARVLTAIGVPTPRVGYAYVRLNGDDYGLYANVETIDKVMAKRWFGSTQHIYEANYGADVVEGAVDRFDVSTGSAKDVSDLEALVRAASGDGAGWAERMKPVADLAELARAFAAEHYIGQWDGYSYGSTQSQPNNYDLESDDGGRFSLIVTGTDQTWLEGENFGLTGNGVLFRECLASAECQALYVEALRKLASSRDVRELAATARAVREAIAPWRRRDPRREQSAAEGEAQAEAKIAFMASRPGQLDAWLGKGSSPGPAALAAPPAAGPRLGKPAASPAAPVAGRRFGVSLAATRSDTGAPLRTGKVACRSSAGVSPVATSCSLAKGRVRLSLTVPKAARGTLLRVRVEVTAARGTGLGIYTFRIR